MGSLFRDIRYAARVLAARPGFTAVAVLTLALGIGANTTIFSWVKALLLQPLPGVPEQERLAVLLTTSALGDFRSSSYPDFVDLRDGIREHAGLVAFEMAPLSWASGAQTERVWGCLVSGNYFDVLGVPAALGRTFLPEEDRTPEAAPVVVVSHGFWKRHLGGDPAAVGKKTRFNGRELTIVGVAPEGFAGTMVGLSFDVWIPMMMQAWMVPGDRLGQRGERWLEALARLGPGVGLEQAQAEVDGVARRLAQEFPETNAGQGAALLPLWKSPWGAPEIFRPVLAVLAGVVGLVLLIACANVANLSLARSAGRSREIAIRLSVGAGRGRLVRQLLTESLLLAALGGAAGLFLALWSSGLLAAFLPPTHLPVGVAPSVGSREFLFALGLTALTGMVFGLAPALQATRPDVVAALKDEAGALAGSRHRSKLRNVLVVAQVALSLLLLVSAGLFLRSLRNAQGIDPGFDTRSLLLGSVDLLPNGYDEARGLALYRELLRRVQGVPGVRSASFAQRVPLGFDGRSDTTISIEGYEPRADEELDIEYNVVGPGYFGTMGIPIEAGRDFAEQDGPGQARVVIVNDAFARRYWPGAEPLGRRIRIGDETIAVVGVAHDIRQHGLGEEAYPFLYWPLFQHYRPDVVLHVRAEGDPLGVVEPVRQEVQRLDPSLPLFDVKPIGEHLRIAVFTQRMSGMLLGGFGLLALVLAAVGIYGVMAYSVSLRTHEIGLRMALGADARDVLRLVVGQGLRLTGIGIVLGMAGALGMTRLVQGQLLGVSPTDPATFAAVALLLGAVAVLASYLPARRAAHLDPLVALRHE
jgi:putative ABC transport system permease protein